MAQINEVGNSEVGEILGKAPNAISSITSILGYYRIRAPVTYPDSSRIRIPITDPRCMCVH